MAYAVEVKAAAARHIRKLPSAVQEQLAPVIFISCGRASPVGTVKLAGSDDLYRVRSGDYCIIYQIQDQRLIVVIVKVAHRREVYR